MADLNPVIEDSFAEAHSIEKRSSKAHNVLSRNSILMSSGGIHNRISSATRQRCQSSRNSSYRPGYERRLIRYENTYRMEPDDDQKVDIIRVRRIATSIIETTIAGYKYNVNHAKQFSMTLAERIRSQIKQLLFSRYKIVVLVSIGQKKGQDLRITSRCIWDFKYDRYITITKETSDAFVTVTIFYIYTE